MMMRNQYSDLVSPIHLGPGTHILTLKEFLKKRPEFHKTVEREILEFSLIHPALLSQLCMEILVLSFQIFSSLPVGIIPGFSWIVVKILNSVHIYQPEFGGNRIPTI